MTSKKKNDSKLLLKLRDIRREKGLSLNTLAQKAGFDYQKIGRLERGETELTLSALNHLANVLDVSPHALLNSDLNALEENMSPGSHTNTSIYIIPKIYEKFDGMFEKYNINVANSVKVHIATVMFKSIEDIRINVKSDEAVLTALFQVFDAILERLVLSKENVDESV